MHPLYTTRFTETPQHVFTLNGDVASLPVMVHNRVNDSKEEFDRVTIVAGKPLYVYPDSPAKQAVVDIVIGYLTQPDTAQAKTDFLKANEEHVKLVASNFIRTYLIPANPYVQKAPYPLFGFPPGVQQSDTKVPGMTHADCGSYGYGGFNLDGEDSPYDKFVIEIQTNNHHFKTVSVEGKRTKVYLNGEKVKKSLVKLFRLDSLIEIFNNLIACREPETESFVFDTLDNLAVTYLGGLCPACREAEEETLAGDTLMDVMSEISDMVQSAPIKDFSVTFGGDLREVFSNAPKALRRNITTHLTDDGNPYFVYTVVNFKNKTDN